MAAGRVHHGVRIAIGRARVRQVALVEGDRRRQKLARAAAEAFETEEENVARDMDYLAAIRCRTAQALVLQEGTGRVANLASTLMGIPMLTQGLQDSNGMLQHLIDLADAPEDLLIKLDTRSARDALLEYLDDTERLLTSPSLSYYLGANRVMVKNLAEIRAEGRRRGGALREETMELVRGVEHVVGGERDVHHQGTLSHHQGTGRAARAQESLAQGEEGGTRARGGTKEVGHRARGGAPSGKIQPRRLTTKRRVPTTRGDSCSVVNVSYVRQSESVEMERTIRRARRRRTFVDAHGSERVLHPCPLVTFVSRTLAGTAVFRLVSDPPSTTANGSFTRRRWRARRPRFRLLVPSRLGRRHRRVRL